VLDIGAGTGANLSYLRAAARVVATEPDPAMRRRLIAHVATRAAARDGRGTSDAADGRDAVDEPAGAGGPVEVVDATAESLPFPDAAFDAVVCTLVLCTVDDLDRALTEARRVLRPGGRLIVLEHVRGSGRLARWQDRVEPLWRRIAAGCHPNRDTRAAIERAGFGFERVEEFQPMPAWIPTSVFLEAVAIR